MFKISPSLKFETFFHLLDKPTFKLYLHWRSLQLNHIGQGMDMGEIGKQRQLTEKKWYGVVRDLSFYETRWILKLSFKHHLKNEIKILKFGLNRLKQHLNNISHIISLLAVFTFFNDSVI